MQDSNQPTQLQRLANQVHFTGTIRNETLQKIKPLFDQKMPKQVLL